MTGSAKLMTPSGGGVLLQPSGNTASDVTVNVPTQNCTLGIQGPAFSAYSTSAQTISANTPTLIVFNSETYDTASCFDNTTFKFTPNVAGYYQINVIITYSGSAGAFSVAAIYKNGATYKIWNTQRANANYNSVVGSDIIYMNGTTDYLSVYGFESVTAGTIVGQTTNTFSGALVRAA